MFFYSFLPEQQNCLPCEPGFYQTIAGSTDCNICPSGTFSRQGSVHCTPCQAGAFSDSAGSGECTSCPAGQFTGFNGETSCKNCTAGSFSNERANSCSMCRPGHYNEVDDLCEKWFQAIMWIFLVKNVFFIPETCFFVRNVFFF